MSHSPVAGGVAFSSWLRYNADMKLRHAAASMLVAWLLMTPPPNNSGDTPIGGWVVQHSYDSVDACTTALTKERDQAATRLRYYDSMTDAQRRNLEHNQDSFNQEMADRDNFYSAFHSACIESDDPRLKEK